MTRPTVKRGRISGSRNRWAIIGASIGLVGLIGVVTVGSLVTSKAAGASARAVRIADAYDHAAGAIAAEESLERKYRLEPGPVPKAAHAAAEASLQQAMRQVAVLGDSADRNLARVVLREHEAYVAASARLFLSVDRHDPVAVTNSIDTRSVDPVFHVMEQQVYGAAAHHELTALNAAASVRNIGRFVLTVDLITLLAGIGLVVGAAVVVTSYQRALQSESEHNRHQALHDPLTDLPNRTLFQDRTGVALRAAARSGATVAGCSWISTGLKKSTTPSATTTVMSSFSRWPIGSGNPCVMPTPWPASVATSSRFFSPFPDGERH